MTIVATPSTTRTAVKTPSRIPATLAIAATTVRFLLGLGLLGACLALAYLLAGAPSPHTFLLAVGAGVYSLVCLTDAARMASTIGARS